MSNIQTIWIEEALEVWRERLEQKIPYNDRLYPGENYNIRMTVPIERLRDILADTGRFEQFHDETLQGKYQFHHYPGPVQMLLRVYEDTISRITLHPRGNNDDELEDASNMVSTIEDIYQVARTKRIPFYIYATAHNRKFVRAEYNPNNPPIE